MFRRGAHWLRLTALAAATSMALSNCAAPQPDPYVVYINQRLAAIKAMPDDTPSQRAAKEAAFDKWEQDVDRERRTRAMESIAESQARIAEPQPTPYVFPTPIRVQVVPNPYGY
jgi:hypothetical protein